MVGKLHDLNESQAWNAVSFTCTILNIPMYLEACPREEAPEGFFLEGRGESTNRIYL